MVFLWRLSFLLFLCYCPVNAGIFDTLDNLEKAQKEADTLKLKLRPGKIWAVSADGKDCLDFASATVVGLPEQEETQTILSCAHTYHIAKSRDPDCHFYFIGHRGVRHPIKTVIPLMENRSDPANDVAIYHLEKSIPHNPLNDIAREFPQEATLSSLPYGWTVALDDIQSIRNISGEKPCFMQNTFQASENTYIHQFHPNQLLRLSSDYKDYKQYFYADSNTQTPQIFPHGSGASWFRENDMGGHSLFALNSQSSTTMLFDRTMADKGENKIKEAHFSWGETHYTIGQYALQEWQGRIYKNILTPLAPHRDWIMLQYK